MCPENIGRRTSRYVFIRLPSCKIKNQKFLCLAIVSYLYALKCCPTEQFKSLVSSTRIRRAGLFFQVLTINILHGVRTVPNVIARGTTPPLRPRRAFRFVSKRSSCTVSRTIPSQAPLFPNASARTPTRYHYFTYLCYIPSELQ